jgi:hypothetical protein
MDYLPSQAVQSSVWAGLKMRAGGWQLTKKCALELVLNCWFSEMREASHAGRVHATMCLTGIVGSN